jgi:hypothetical protein
MSEIRKDTFLLLDRISGSSSSVARNFYDKLRSEDFAKYFEWLENEEDPSRIRKLAAHIATMALRFTERLVDQK